MDSGSHRILSVPLKNHHNAKLFIEFVGLFYLTKPFDCLIQYYVNLSRQMSRLNV